LVGGTLGCHTHRANDREMASCNMVILQVEGTLE
jgi:hypothetical protein